jgi:hypothetical protein
MYAAVVVMCLAGLSTAVWVLKRDSAQTLWKDLQSYGAQLCLSDDALRTIAQFSLAPRELMFESIVRIQVKWFTVLLVGLVLWSTLGWVGKQLIDRMSPYTAGEDADDVDIRGAPASYLRRWLLVFVVVAILTVTYVTLSGATLDAVLSHLGLFFTFIVALVLCVVLLRWRKIFATSPELANSYLVRWTGVGRRVRVYYQSLVLLILIATFLLLYLPAMYRDVRTEFSGLGKAVEQRRKQIDLRPALGSIPAGCSIEGSNTFLARLQVLLPVLHRFDSQVEGFQNSMVHEFSDLQFDKHRSAWASSLLCAFSALFLAVATLGQIAARLSAFGREAIVLSGPMLWRSCLTIGPVLSVAFVLDRLGVNTGRPLFWLVISATFAVMDMECSLVPSDFNTVVYIVRGGVSFHCSLDCPALSHVRPEDLLQPSEKQARLWGCKPCKRCPGKKVV